MSLRARLLAECLGTLLLLAIVIGSGIMAERLAGGNVALALLANTLATVFGLYVLIEVFGPVSGAHFNPAVSAVMAWRGELPRSLFPPYVLAQLVGAMLGAWLAHAMFELPLLQWSAKLRGGNGQWIAEAVATAGLLLVILRAPAGRAPALVAAWIGAAYWFTASTSFANPAAALGRMFSDSFAGISPASVPAFVLAQLAGACIGVLVHHGLRARAAHHLATESTEQRASAASALDPSIAGHAQQGQRQRAQQVQRNGAAGEQHAPVLQQGGDFGREGGEGGEPTEEAGDHK
jgi:glycerol uptake facilitator-like aquaporin